MFGLSVRAWDFDDIGVATREENGTLRLSFDVFRKLDVFSDSIEEESLFLVSSKEIR